MKSMDASQGRPRALSVLVGTLALGATLRALPHSLPSPVAASSCASPTSAGEDRWAFRTLGCGEDQGAPPDGAHRLLLGLRMDLNTATPADLESLPGIGPHTAQKIVAWRQEHGQFDRVEALEDVRGVGPRTVARLEPLVEVRPPPVVP